MLLGQVSSPLASSYSTVHRLRRMKGRNQSSHNVKLLQNLDRAECPPLQLSSQSKSIKQHVARTLLLGIFVIETDMLG